LRSNKVFLRLCAATNDHEDRDDAVAQGEQSRQAIRKPAAAAFVAACELHLKIGDPAARFVAEKVIELTQRGIRDPDMLRTMTLEESGLSDESGPL
jgi:hypothetical protein